MTILATSRSLLQRPMVLLLGLLSVLMVGCSSVGGPTYSFWDAIWTMIAFFFWFMFIWIFISLFGDIFRRNDLSGGWKAIWIVVLCPVAVPRGVDLHRHAAQGHRPGRRR